MVLPPPPPPAIINTSALVTPAGTVQFVVAVKVLTTEPGILPVPYKPALNNCCASLILNIPAAAVAAVFGVCFAPMYPALPLGIIN
jgi:hypothetical protein